MPKNKHLNGAKKNKQDEFYTTLSDIENEMKYYEKQFRNKTVLCNCDDPHDSKFFRYFSVNFNILGLKNLITTSYNGKHCQYFHREPELGFTITYNPNNEKERWNKKYLKDGDFRSDECIEILRQADIVVTNPPFSLFREYMDQLVQKDKKFLILGHQNAIHYKDIFPLIKNNKIWLGKSIHSGGREFMVPKDYEFTTKNSRVDEYGNRFVEVPGVRWFTNLNAGRHYEDLVLTCKYTPEKYPKYDDYDAINIDKTKDIPIDYNGKMGVPLTFIDKYNPDQFEILGLDVSIDNRRGKSFTLDGKIKYTRIIIKHKQNNI